VATKTVLPTSEELAAALALLREAPNVISVSSAVRLVAEFEGNQAPTLEDIGRLYVWARDARRYLDEALNYVTQVDDALYELDYVRVHDNVDPDAVTCTTCGTTATNHATQFGRWLTRLTPDGTDVVQLCPDCRAAEKP
jgi:hypothetical protein